MKRNWITHCIVAIVAIALAPMAWADGGGPSVTPDEAFQALADGNKRYVAGQAQHAGQSQERRTKTAKGQRPFASIVSCSDSRVPVEIVFDQGVGDLFLVRVAGNVVNTDELGSMEYGTEHLHTPVLIIMGHTKCGAVVATVQDAEVHGSIPALLKTIRPAVARAKHDHPDLKDDALVAEATKVNVWLGIENTFKNSATIRNLVKASKLKVIGALYDVELGNVIWLGTHPDQDRLIAGQKLRR